MNHPPISTDDRIGCARAARSIRLPRPLILLLALLLGPGPAAVLAATTAGDPPETLIFESRPPGHAGGGLSVVEHAFHGHTFRVTERTQVTRVGTYAQAFAARTVFVALYRVNMPAAGPDVVNDSQLIATSLLDVPATGFDSAVEVSTELSATLEPGWYAIMVGTGRHGATAPNHSVTIVGTGTATAPQSRGPYSVNTSTNAITFQGTTSRYFVYGHSLPPAPPRPATEFFYETASPAAWWSASGSTLNGTQFIGVRFSVERMSRLDQLSTWLGFGDGGNLFAAIYPLTGPTGNPPAPNSTAFETAAIYSTLLNIGSWDEYTVDLGGQVLMPGHYAVVFGSGKFGATGTGAILRVADQVVVPGSLISAGSTWFGHDNFSVRLTGIVPELSATPQQIDFGQVPLTGSASRSVTLTNLRDDAALEIAAINVAPGPFALDADAGDCLVIAAGSQCSFTVHYAADSLGIHDGVIEVLADAVPDELLLPMTGETVASAVVTPGTAGNGSIDPDTAQLLVLGETASFTLTPAPGHHLDQLSGNCGGDVDGLIYTTAPVSADCAFVAVFAINTYTVTGSAGAHGSITPAGAQTVEWGSSLSYALIPDLGYRVDQVISDCDGSLDGLIYDTGPVTADCSVHALFEIEPATTLSLVSGSGQSTQVGTAFAAPLVLRVSNDADLPVPGVTVQFQAPATGASATLPATAISDGEGEVSIAMTANTVAGTYSITAMADGLSGDLQIQLDNLPGPAEELVAVTGSGQSAQVGNGFPVPLRVRVVDSFDNPVPGVQVEFTAPASGASAVLTPSSMVSGEDGEAETDAVANAVPGIYVVTATIADTAIATSLDLENLPPNLVLTATIDDDRDHVAYGEINEYLVTIGNAGSDPATGVEVLVPLPLQLDAELTEWLCLDTTTGCTAAGTGSLADSGVTVPAGGAVRYRIITPVLSDAAGDGIEIEAYAEANYHGPVDGHDHTFLVLFRDDFEASSKSTEAIAQDGTTIGQE